MVMVTENIIIANIDYATNGFSSLVGASLCMSLQCYQHIYQRLPVHIVLIWMDAICSVWDRYTTTQHVSQQHSMHLSFILCDCLGYLWKIYLQRKWWRKNGFWLTASRRCSVSWSEDLAVGREGIMAEGDGWLVTLHQLQKAKSEKKVRSGYKSLKVWP